MPTVVLDVTDARGPALRGWGRYVARLEQALLGGAAGDLQIRVVARAGRGPELAWEQLGLPRRAKLERADVVHAPNCFLPLWRPCAGVVSVHDLAFELYRGDFARKTGLKYRVIAPRAARSAQRVICVSRFTARDVIERYGVDEARVRVIALAPALASGVRGDDAGGAGDGGGGDGGDAGARGDARPYLLGVGDLRAKKDFLTLVRAWRQLRREGFEHRLVLAGGDAGERQRLRAAAGEEPLELTGYVSDVRLDALMRGASALVHPSLYEGFGLVLLEAMARGTAVVAARATALPETGGDAALYFEPSDVDDLAARLRALLTDRSLQQDLVARGRVRAAEFSWERTARATADVYRELTA